MSDRLTQAELRADTHPAPVEERGSMLPDRPRACVACGGGHGSVGAGRLCLEAEVKRLRIVLAAAHNFVCRCVP